MPRSKRGNKRGGNIDRQITSKIRSLRLNSAPTWYDVRKRSTDPPQYVEDSIYQRKVRMVISAPGIGVNIHPADVVAAAGLPSGAFEHLAVMHITAYGSQYVTGTAPTFLLRDGAGIRINTRIIQGVTDTAGDARTLPDREFSDFGVPGAKRACVAVRINPKDQGFIDSTAVAATARLCHVQLLDATGLGVVGAIIVDMFVQFNNTPALVRRRREEHFAEKNWEADYAAGIELEVGPGRPDSH